MDFFSSGKKIKFSILKKYNIKKIKIGHAGTLDPLATGLLVLCTGKKTKTIPFIQEFKKVYTGEIQLGAETPSYDLETEISKTYDTEDITKEKVLECAKNFEGESLQNLSIFLH